MQLQKIRGQLFRDPQNGPVEVVASGRGDWVGWFELRREDVYWKATFNTARVISEVRPDILICVEVENRATLDRFNDQVLRTEFQFSPPHFMVVDGNDARGIDVGILSRYPIVEIRSHVDDLGSDGKRLFSRDCPEYDIILPTGARLVLIPNHPQVEAQWQRSGGARTPGSASKGRPHYRSWRAVPIAICIVGW